MITAPDEQEKPIATEILEAAVVQTVIVVEESATRALLHRNDGKRTR
ncbi:MAG: hypothetical protein ACFC1C_01005 [Candidatus Malihini olakiniferum]